MMSTWTYMRTEPRLFTVGFHDPSGEWHTDSDHNDQAEAAERVRELNGGPRSLDVQIRALRERAEGYEEYYRLLADHVIKTLNPRDGDEDEGFLCQQAIDKAVAFIEAHRCVCATDAAETGEHICPRCDALGRVCDRQVDR